MIEISIQQWKDIVTIAKFLSVAMMQYNRDLGEQALAVIRKLEKEIQ